MFAQQERSLVGTGTGSRTQNFYWEEPGTVLPSDLKLSHKVLPAIAEGPRICQRKNMARAICRGLAQAMLRYSIRSMNFCVSMDIRLVVSPTGKDQFYINCYQIQNPKKLLNKKLRIVNLAICIGH